MTQRLTIRVSGYVQGVNFRRSAQAEAERLGLAGWVQNIPQGGVHIEVEGKKDKTEEFLYWCRRGPSLARVDKVEVEEKKPIGYKEFEVH